jgi:hypothetical protein
MTHRYDWAERNCVLYRNVFIIRNLDITSTSSFPDDRLCQGVEETTVTQYNGKGEPVRTVHKRRLLMPSKVDCADPSN